MLLPNAHAQTGLQPASVLVSSETFPSNPGYKWQRMLPVTVVGPQTYSKTESYTSRHRIWGSTVEHPWTSPFKPLRDRVSERTLTASIVLGPGTHTVAEEWYVDVRHGYESWRFVTADPEDVQGRNMTKAWLAEGQSFRLVLVEN